MAHGRGLQLRVRGAAHSVSYAIYPDPVEKLPNRVSWQTPPKGENVSVMLDRYCGWRVRDEAHKLVEADAGIHLGPNPSDPTGTATLEASFLWQLWDRKRWTLSNVGGITHQTVSGFTATGSSGGSLMYSSNDNLWGFRVIDGTGDVHELTREDADPDLFYSTSPSMGLLGVISTIIFKCEDAYNITGQEATTTIEECPVDLFGEGGPDRPALEQFLRDAEYSRFVWYPQRGAERVLVWQAQRIAPQPGFRPTRYQEVGAHPERSQVPTSLLLTVLGNLHSLPHAREQVKRTFTRVESLLELLPALERLGELGKLLAKFLSHGAEYGADAAIELLRPFGGLIERELPTIYPKLLDMFVPLDSDKPGLGKGEPQAFRDYAWQGLPMDNAIDDEMMPTGFTEMWVPLGRTQDLMQLLRKYFTEPEDVHEAYRRTGLYAWEAYAAKPTRLWMNASYSNDEDQWKEGVFRVDAYWFEANPGDPSDTFYLRLWELLRDNGMPFRLHWGKYQPKTTPKDPEWVEFFKTQYPRWDDFLRLRAERDPKDIFLTDYWRERFGLWHDPPPGG